LATFTVASSVPGLIGLLVKCAAGRFDRSKHWGNLLNGYLQVDASSEWPVHLGRLPSPITFAQHDLRGSSRQEGKSRCWSIVSDLKAEQLTPEA
jgi:hypothetical protein